MHRYMRHLDDLAGLDMLLARDGTAPAPTVATVATVGPSTTFIGVVRAALSVASRVSHGPAAPGTDRRNAFLGGTR